MGEIRESVSRDRVVEASPVVELIKMELLQDDKYGNQTDCVEGNATVESDKIVSNEERLVVGWIVDHSSGNGRGNFKVRW